MSDTDGNAGPTPTPLVTWINHLSGIMDKARTFRQHAITTEKCGAIEGAAAHALVSIACSLEVIAAIAVEREATVQK